MTHLVKLTLVVIFCLSQSAMAQIQEMEPVTGGSDVPSKNGDVGATEAAKETKDLDKTGDVNFDVVIGKLKILGKTDDQIRETFRALGLSKEEAQCFLDSCKDQAQLSDKERHAIIQVVEAEGLAYDALTRKLGKYRESDLNVLSLDRQLLLVKLELAGKSRDEVFAFAKSKGLSDDDAQCLADNCQRTLAISPDEFRSLSEAISLSTWKVQVIQELMDEQIKKSSMNHRIELIITNHLGTIEKLKQELPTSRSIAKRVRRIFDDYKNGPALDQDAVKVNGAHQKTSPKNDNFDSNTKTLDDLLRKSKL